MDPFGHRDTKPVSRCNHTKLTGVLCVPTVRFEGMAVPDINGN